MRRKNIKSFFIQEIHTISFSDLAETKELLTDKSAKKGESAQISYPTSVELCKDSIKLYCHWQVGNFAYRIRKIFECEFIKSMHDYFEQSKFLNKMYPTLQQLVSTEGITEKELIENSAEIRTRQVLKRRKECAAVYDKMLKGMTKLGRKITDMGNGNYGKF